MISTDIETRREIMTAIKKIVAAHTDMSEAAKDLIKNKYACSMAQGKRIFMQMKDIEEELKR